MTLDDPLTPQDGGGISLRLCSDEGTPGSLTEAAQSAARTKGTYLAAHLHSARSRRGTFKAIGATRHDILVAYWHIVHDVGVDYIDLGADWAVRRQGPEHQLARLVRQIEKLGREVTVTMPGA